MFTGIASHLTGTSLCSLTLLPISLANLYVHWHCFPSHWQISMYTDIASPLTGKSVCSLTLLPISLVILYVHWHCFPSHLQLSMYTDIASHLTSKSVCSLTLLPISLAILCVSWHYFPSYKLPSLYSQIEEVHKRWLWLKWWQNDGKWKMDSQFWYAAEAWSGCYLHMCYDDFVKVGCGGLHGTSCGNEVLLYVQVQLSAVSFFLSYFNMTLSFLPRGWHQIYP
jgi:hypothetical protein